MIDSEQEGPPGPAIDTIHNAFEEIERLGVTEARTQLPPELTEILIPPGDSQEALKLVRSYQPGSYPLSYAELEIPELDMQEIETTFATLRKRVETVFGEPTAIAFDIIFNGGNVLPPLHQYIVSRRSRYDIQESKKHKEKIVQDIRMRICQAARFLLYSISYEPYQDRDSRWFGCPVDPNSFLTCILFTAFSTPSLKEYDFLKRLKRTALIANYIHESEFACYTSKYFQISGVSLVKTAIDLRLKLEDLRRDQLRVNPPFHSDKLYGQEPGKSLKLSPLEIQELLLETRQVEALTALAVGSIVTLSPNSRKLLRAYYYEHQGDTEISTMDIYPEQVEELMDRYGRDVVFEEIAQPDGLFESRLAFFCIAPLVQGWTDGVILDTILDISFQVMCPIKFEAARNIVSSGMAYHLNGSQVQIGPLKNEAVILAWASAIYMYRLSELYWRYSGKEIQRLIKIYPYVCARVKGVFSQWCKSLDLKTGFTPYRRPLTYNAWRSQIPGYNDPTKHSMDMLGTTLVLDYPRTKKGIEAVMIFFTSLFAACPFIEGVYVDSRHADPEKPEKGSYYFAIHTAYVICIIPIEQRTHKPGDVNVVEMHLTKGLELQEAYLGQHLPYAESKTHLAETSFEDLHRSLVTVAIIYAITRNLSPRDAYRLVWSQMSRFSLHFNDNCVTPSATPKQSLHIERRTPITLRGGSVFDLLYPHIREPHSLIALIRVPPLITIHAKKNKRRSLPHSSRLHVTPALISLAMTGLLPTDVAVTTNHAQIIAAIRRSQPKYLGRTLQEQQYVDSLIELLIEYFKINGDNWLSIESKTHQNHTKMRKQEVQQAIEYLETQSKSGHTRSTKIIEMLNNFNRPLSIFIRILPIARRCGMYQRILENPYADIHNQSELVNLITIGSSSGEDVRNIILKYLIDMILRERIDPHFLHLCAVKADKLYEGSGEIPSKWIEKILELAKQSKNNILENFIATYFSKKP